MVITRFQSAGTTVEDAMGVRLAGKWIDEVLTGDFLALTANALVDIVAAPSIKIYRNRIAVGADELFYDRLLLPYSGDDGLVCFVTSTGGWPPALKELIDANRAQVFAPPYRVRAI